MIQRKFKIKDGVLLETTEVRIEDCSKLLKYNMNLRKLADDIRRSRNDEHFENFLLKAEELFAEEIEKAKVLKNPVFGSHSVFYYMYGHMSDWVRYAENEVIYAKALLTQACHIVETVQIIRYSRNIEDAANKLMEVLNLDEIGAKYVANQRLSILTGISPEQHKESIIYFEKRLSNVKELAKYDK
jgi:hypothetical protein